MHKNRGSGNGYRLNELAIFRLPRMIRCGSYSVEWVVQAFSVLGRIPEDTVDIGRGIKAPQWYRGMTHVNLPDAHIGYAVMDIDEAGTKLQTFVQ